MTTLLVHSEHPYEAARRCVNTPGPAGTWLGGPDMAERTCSLDGCGSPKTRRRFYSKVNVGAADACHLWTGETNNKGYGRFSAYRDDDRHRHLVHRLVVEWSLGRPLTSSEVVRHTCDTPPCVRRDHLRVGTQADNVRDAVAKGRMDMAGLEMGRGRVRARIGGRCRHGHLYVGSNVYRHPRGYIVCRECRRESQRRYVERAKLQRRGAA